MTYASSRFAAIAGVILFLVVPTLQMTQYTGDPSSCDIVGDGDVYGIGVRLGYYFSWISGLTAVFFDNPKAVRDTRRAVILISFAVFIIIVRNTLNGSFALLEWSIVFPMAIWAPLLVVFFASIMNQDDAPGAISLVTIMGAVLVTHPWVWFTRTQQGRRPECEVKGFIFVYFDFYNRHFQSFVRFLAVVYCISGCGMIIWAIIRILRYIAKGRKGNDGPETPAAGGNQMNISQMQMQHILPSPEVDTTNMMEVVMKAWPVRAAMVLPKLGLAAAGVSTIVFAEKILAVNNIDLSDAPLLSSGQLIPFIVGLAGLVSTIWSVTIGERLALAHKRRRERAVPLNEIMT
ncbi:uncharacterized protein BDW70DRAFT_155443 [Aspergillus foveolatus]|uniref:uncharacterized protein n=1 Tax=Aspergillus foveolatus TaxID=210207 RepID=UPI003CCDBD8A